MVKRRVQEVLGRADATRAAVAQAPRGRASGSNRAHAVTTSLWIGLFAVLFSLALIIVLRNALDSRRAGILERSEALLARK